MSVRKRLIAYVMCYVMALSALPVSVAGAEGDGISAGSVSSGVSSQTPKLADNSTIAIKDGAELTYGKTLSELEFAEVKFVDNAGNEVKGNLAWTKPDEKPNAGKKVEAEWIFTPENTDTYQSVKGKIEITVKKADPEIKPSATAFTKTYGESGFNLGVTHTNKDQNAALQYNVTSGTDVISVSSDGTVTILKGGSASISVSLPESNNFNAANNITITVNVEKKDSQQPETIQKEYIYSTEKSDEIDLSGYLPGDCGTNVSYTVTTEGNVGYTVQPEVEKGTLSYTVQQADSEKSGTITVTITTDNYKDITVKVNVYQVSKRAVTPQSAEGVSLKSNTLTYGQTLSELKFKDVAFVDVEDSETVVEGKLAWSNENEVLNAGTTEAEWTFTPDDSVNYISVTGKVVITVDQATPAITSPTPEYKKIFGDSDFNLGFTNNNKDSSAVTKYKVKSGSDVVSVSSDGTVKILKVGTAEIIAFLLPTENYNRAESNPVKITITCTHKGPPVTAINKDRTDTAEGLVIRKCSIPGCDHEMERFLLPQKTVEIELGGEPKSIISNSSKCTFDFANAKKYKKYFKFNTKTGKMEAFWNKKNNKKVKITDSIPIDVKTGGRSYRVNVKIKFPDPKMKVQVKNTGGGDYRFKFKYKIPNAKKVKIRCKNKNIKINTKVFDYYLSSPKSNSDSYIYLHLTKTNEVTFTITAYYGKNNKRSETTEYTVPIPKKKK